MSQVLPGVSRWIVFSDEERAVLLEAFSIKFPALGEAGAVCEQCHADSTTRRFEGRGPKTRSLLAIRDKLLESLTRGDHAILSMTDKECEAIRELVMEGIVGYYDFLVRLEDQMTSAGIEFIPVEDDRQIARLSVFYKLNVPKS